MPNPINDIVKLFYPENCYVCGKPLKNVEKMFCTNCLFNLPLTNNHLYPENKTTELFYGRAVINYGLSLFSYNKASEYKNLLYSLKYHKKTEIGFELGKFLGLAIKESPYITDIDAIVPVPLHLKKMKIRGYNQSAWIAKGISSILNISVDEKTLIRNTHTKTQTKKTRIERWENVKSVFDLSSQNFEGKHIILVDDVITTGATIEACINAINEKAKVKITVATLAIA